MASEFQDAFTALRVILDCVKNQDYKRRQEACLLCFDILLMVHPKKIPPENHNVELLKAMLRKSKEGAKYDHRFHTYIDTFEKLISKTPPQENTRLQRELKRLEISR